MPAGSQAQILPPEPSATPSTGDQHPLVPGHLLALAVDEKRPIWHVLLPSYEDLPLGRSGDSNCKQCFRTRMTNFHAHRRLRALCRTLLKRMAPEHKFATAARLCSEVLSGFADGALSLGAAPEVLRDALHILASKDVKVGLRPRMRPCSSQPIRPCFASPSSFLRIVSCSWDLSAIIQGSAWRSDCLS